MSANAPQTQDPGPAGSRRQYTLYLASSRAPEPAEPVGRTIGWIEALFIVALVAVSLGFVAGGSFLWMKGVPATDRYGTLAGRVEPRGQGATRLTALDAGARVVVTQEGVTRRIAVATVDSSGRFSVRLRPGTYTLHLVSRDSRLKAAPQTLHVLGGQVLAPTLTARAPVTAASATR